MFWQAVVRRAIRQWARSNGATLTEFETDRPGSRRYVMRLPNGARVTVIAHQGSFFRTVLIKARALHRALFARR